MSLINWLRWFRDGGRNLVNRKIPAIGLLNVIFHKKYRCKYCARMNDCGFFDLMKKDLWGDYIMLRFTTEFEKRQFLEANNIKQGVILNTMRKWDREPPFRGDLI